MTCARLIRAGGYVAWLLAAIGAFAQTTRLKSDQEIIFYPAIAQRVPGTNLWRAEIRCCVFEPEKRRLLLGALHESLGLKGVKMSSEEKQVLDERSRLFLVDHERGKKIFIRLGTNEFFAGKSGANGMFSAQIEFRDVATFKAILPPGDARQFAGEILPLEEEGVSVISDIDDTIKLTEVRDRHAMLRNTFLREFRPAPGMAEFYQTLARSDHATFHYVSASPWQLYEPLSAFVRSNGFPAGTFEFKEFRWKDRSFFSLLASPEKFKPAVIEPLLKQFPKRQFILVGDSGERDPEIYGALARKFPARVTHIYIRDVTGENGESERFTKAFRDLPRAKWQVFREPSEIKVASE